MWSLLAFNVPKLSFWTCKGTTTLPFSEALTTSTLSGTSGLFSSGKGRETNAHQTLTVVSGTVVGALRRLLLQSSQKPTF